MSCEQGGGHAPIPHGFVALSVIAEMSGIDANVLRKHHCGLWKAQGLAVKVPGRGQGGGEWFCHRSCGKPRKPPRVRTADEAFPPVSPGWKAAIRLIEEASSELQRVQNPPKPWRILEELGAISTALRGRAGIPMVGRKSA